MPFHFVLYSQIWLIKIRSPSVHCCCSGLSNFSKTLFFIKYKLSKSKWKSLYMIIINIIRNCDRLSQIHQRCSFLDSIFCLPFSSKKIYFYHTFWHFQLNNLCVILSFSLCYFSVYFALHTRDSICLSIKRFHVLQCLSCWNNSVSVPFVFFPKHISQVLSVILFQMVNLVVLPFSSFR